MVVHSDVLRHSRHDSFDGEPVSGPSHSSSDETWWFGFEELVEGDFLILKVVELVDGGGSEVDVRAGRS